MQGMLTQAMSRPIQARPHGEAHTGDGTWWQIPLTVAATAEGSMENGEAEPSSWPPPSIVPRTGIPG